MRKQGKFDFCQVGDMASIYYKLPLCQLMDKVFRTDKIIVGLQYGGCILIYAVGIIMMSFLWGQQGLALAWLPGNKILRWYATQSYLYSREVCMTKRWRACKIDEEKYDIVYKWCGIVWREYVERQYLKRPLLEAI